MQPKSKALKAVSNLVTRTGTKVPQIALGTYQITGQECLANMKAALQAGYTHFDTAQFYDNEREIGQAIKESNAPRESLFITSKLNSNQFGQRAVKKSCQSVLHHLGTTYIDLMMIHWPGVVGISPNSPQNSKLRLQTWKSMIDLKKQGKVRDIGVANFLPRHLQTLRLHSSEMPVVNQIELNPAMLDKETISYCRQQGILISASSPLARRPPMLLNHPQVLKLSQKYNKTPSQIILNWGIVQKFIVCPKSTNPENIQKNIDIFDFAISDQEVNRLSNLGVSIPRVLNPEVVKY